MPREATTNQARALRRTSTVTERLLWRKLRGRRLEGLKFRRQVAIGPYVVDFLCLRHRLIVEADGPFHEAEEDAVRDAWLAAHGFQVLRFDNRTINAFDDQVADKILDAVGRPPPLTEF
jgi:very-short-patch-repair endonuclease